MGTRVRLGLHVGVWRLPVRLVREADSLGYHSVWTGESESCDALTRLAWIGALTDRLSLGSGVAHLTAREPWATASAATTIHRLSGRAVLLGLGMPRSPNRDESGRLGAQAAIRTYVEAVRREIAARIDHDAVAIYLGATAPASVRLAGEIADGWVASFYAPSRRAMLNEPLAQGLSAASRNAREFDVAAIAMVVVGDDVDACRWRVKQILAAYIGGLASRGDRTHLDLAVRLGYEDAVDGIVSAAAERRHGEAARAVPDSLVDEVALCGPPERIRDGVAAWRDADIGTLIIGTRRSSALRLMAELVL